MITETNAILTTVASDTSVKNTLATIVDNDNLSIAENIQILGMQIAIKTYMENCAPALFSTVRKHNGNPVFDDLVLTYTFSSDTDKANFEIEYAEFLAAEWTFESLDKITLTRSHIPYPNAETLLDKFIAFED